MNEKQTKKKKKKTKKRNTFTNNMLIDTKLSKLKKRSKLKTYKT